MSPALRVPGTGSVRLVTAMLIWWMGVARVTRGTLGRRISAGLVAAQMRVARYAWITPQSIRVRCVETTISMSQLWMKDLGIASIASTMTSTPGPPADHVMPAGSA